MPESFVLCAVLYKWLYRRGGFWGGVEKRGGVREKDDEKETEKEDEKEKERETREDGGR